MLRHVMINCISQSTSCRLTCLPARAKAKITHKTKHTATKHQEQNIPFGLAMHLFDLM